jgi:hypothetical protein
MVTCSVFFYREILGVPFAAPRGQVEVRLARNQIRAIEAAKRKFARRLGLSDWRLGADTFDLICPDTQEGSLQRASAVDAVQRRRKHRHDG